MDIVVIVADINRQAKRLISGLKKETGADKVVLATRNHKRQEDNTLTVDCQHIDRRHRNDSLYAKGVISTVMSKLSGQAENKQSHPEVSFSKTGTSWGRG